MARSAACAAVLLLGTGCGVRLEPAAGVASAIVEIRLPLGADALRRRLGVVLAEGYATMPPRRFAPGDWLGCFTLFDRRPPAAGVQDVFPADATLRIGAGDDPVMRRYLARGTAQRARDVFLYNARDCRWASEYRARGRPVRFSCDFILHVEPVGEHETRLEALEVRPQVVLGSHLGLTAHGLGLDWVETHRAVPPTRRDREALLARIRDGRP